MLSLARAGLLLKLTERVSPSAAVAIAADSGGAAAESAPPAKGKADPKKGAPPTEETSSGVDAVEILRAAEVLLSEVSAEVPPASEDGDTPPPATPAQHAANFSLMCEAALLRSTLAQRRGLISDAVTPLRDAMHGAIPTLPWAHLEGGGAAGSVWMLLPSLQPGALHWLRMRLALASLCLHQGQLDAAEEQIDTGRTEANRAHDKRVLRALLLVHARVRVERGELSAAANELKLWLDDAASATAGDGVVTAVASIQYASVLLALSAAAGADGGGGGASKILALLRGAETALRLEAESLGMLSTEKWPCLLQPSPAGQGPSSPLHIASLNNLYLKPLQYLVDAKLKLAVGFQLTSSAPRGMAASAADDAAAALLSEAAALAKITLHPLPSLVSRVQYELGRALRRQAQRASSAAWGGASSAGAVASPEDTPAAQPHDTLEKAAGTLTSALVTLSEGEEVAPGFQAQVLLELALLYGSHLVPGVDDQHLNLAAAYVQSAASCSTFRRSLFADLPAAPSAPLDAAIPLLKPIDDATTQAASLAAQRPHTMQGAAQEGKASRDLLWLASSLARSREVPRANQDVFEQRQLLLNHYLKKACKPFADAIVPPPITMEPRADIPAGYVCFQWYEQSPVLGGATIAPQVSLVFVFDGSELEGVEGSFVLGLRSLPRSDVLATSRLLQHLASVASEAPDSLQESLHAVRELLGVPKHGVSHATSIDDEAPPDVQDVEQLVTVDSLQWLAALFNPLTGSSCNDVTLCGWLRHLLVEAR